MKRGHKIIETWEAVQLTCTLDGRFHLLIPNGYGEYDTDIKPEGFSTEGQAVAYAADRDNWPLQPPGSAQ